MKNKKSLFSGIAILAVVMYGLSINYKDAVGYVFHSETAMATVTCKQTTTNRDRSRNLIIQLIDTVSGREEWVPTHVYCFAELPIEPIESKESFAIGDQIRITYSTKNPTTARFGTRREILMIYASVLLVTIVLLFRVYSYLSNAFDVA